MLSYSGLGFGKTNCKITLDDPDWDGKAGRQMVDVLAGKRAYTTEASTTPQLLKSISTESAGDPRVGMIGGSYGGQIQYAVAMQDPRIDAIIPIITWNDLTYSLAPGNVAKKQWIDLFFGAGIISGAQNATADPETMRVCPNFVDQACIGAAAMNTAGYPDAATVALAKHASVASYVKRIKAPTLLVQGQKDTLFNLNEAVATYRSLQAQKTPVKMVWQSWGHSGSDPVARRARLRRLVTARLLPRQPVPELDGPLRQGREQRDAPARSSSTSATGSSTTPAPPRPAPRSVRRTPRATRSRGTRRTRCTSPVATS